MRSEAQMMMERHKRAVLISWTPTLGYMGLIFFMSSLSIHTPLLRSGVDKAVHFFEYMLLAFLFRFSLSRTTRLGFLKVCLAAFVLTCAYGFTDELHQKFVPGREFDLFDLAANAAGALFVFLPGEKTEVRKNKKE